ncbi:MAG: hypothetical protein AAFY29_21980 [Pseudomonadota bacterium]
MEVLLLLYTELLREQPNREALAAFVDHPVSVAAALSCPGPLVLHQR